MRVAEKKSAKSADVEKVRRYAQQHPSLFDGASLLADSTIKVIMDEIEMKETTRICITGELYALRRSLGAETATPLEKLLIEDVALCWLRLQFVEQMYSQNLNGAGITKRTYLEQWLSATRRRYLQALESLARVRALLARVPLQVNIAQQMLVHNG
jgi:hypothetical protein